MYRTVIPADFGAQLLTKGGFTGRGEEHTGTRWEFKSKKDAEIWKKAMTDPRYYKPMSQDEIRTFVRSMEADPKSAVEVKELSTPTNTLSLIDRTPYERKTYNELIERQPLKETHKPGMLSSMTLMVGAALVALWYFLLRRR